MRKKKLYAVIASCSLILFLTPIFLTHVWASSETFILPTDGTEVGTTKPLIPEVDYLITVSGVVSKWTKGTWDNNPPPCGTPVITESGPTGIDARYVFARPCSNPIGVPYPTIGLKFDLPPLKIGSALFL